MVLDLSDRTNRLQLQVHKPLVDGHSSLVFLKAGDKTIQEEGQQVAARAGICRHSFSMTAVDPATTRLIRMFCSAHGVLSDNNPYNWERVLAVLCNLETYLSASNSYLFRQMYMYELLFPILSKLKPACFIEEKVLATACQILRKTLQDNRDNKRYAERWLSELLEQAVSSPAIQATVSEMVRSVGSSTLSLDELRKYIDDLAAAESFSEILMRILRDLCSLEGRPCLERHRVVL